ncbi:acyl-CoA thioesterase [Candidatus Bathyarchaeota archaeon]|nr:acyl-CoA thioesterase [Candidatus Bathyarchaeota archaeon]
MVAHTSKTLRLRVHAGDTDFTGFVFNPRVIEWFSVGRIELLRSRGITLLDDGRLTVDGKPQGVSLVVGEVYARFQAPIRFDDQVSLKTEVTEVRDKTIKFSFTVRRVSDREVLAVGSSTSVCIDKETRKSCKLPPRIAELLTPSPKSR